MKTFHREYCGLFTVTGSLFQAVKSFKYILFENFENTKEIPFTFTV